MKHLFPALCLPLCITLRLVAADPVFSGPQPGEAITPVTSVDIIGAAASRMVDV